MVYDNRNGGYVQTNMVQRASDGGMEYFPVTDESVFDRLSVIQRGGVILGENENEMNGKNGYYPYGVVPVEGAGGDRVLARTETYSKKGNLQQFQVTLTNANGAPVEMVIFDGMTLVSNKLKLNPLPAPPNFVVGGTWGTDTLTILSEIGGKMPVDLHSIWVQNLNAAGAASTVFFDQGFLKESYAGIANNSLIDEPLPFQTMFRPTDFQENIRVFDGFRYQVNPLAALHLNIPDGETVNITLNISAIGAAYEMIKQ